MAWLPPHGQQLAQTSTRHSTPALLAFCLLTHTGPAHATTSATNCSAYADMPLNALLMTSVHRLTPAGPPPQTYLRWFETAGASGVLCTAAEGGSRILIESLRTKAGRVFFREKMHGAVPLPLPLSAQNARCRALHARAQCTTPALDHGQSSTCWVVAQLMGKRPKLRVSQSRSKTAPAARESSKTLGRQAGTGPQPQRPAAPGTRAERKR